MTCPKRIMEQAVVVSVVCISACFAQGEECPVEWDCSIGIPGTDGEVTALVGTEVLSAVGPALYAGGGFVTAGGEPVNYVAKWDGTQWSPLGTGLDGWVLPEAMVIHDDGSGLALFVGGSFQSSPAKFIGKWDGGSWSSLSGGVWGDVYGLGVYDDGDGPCLYAGGVFSAAGDPPVAHTHQVAQWDGIAWHPLGQGISGAPGNSTVFAFAVFDEDGPGPGDPALYVGGLFEEAHQADGTSVSANNIARWDGDTWFAVSGGTNGVVTTMTVYDDGTGDSLYVGGEFTSAGGVSVSNIARWDGSSWSTLGSGVSGKVWTLDVFDDETGEALFVGGNFTVAGGQPANAIAKWDGVWASLGDGVSGYYRGVSALAAYDDGDSSALYVGGDFLVAGTESANHIAAWVVGDPPWFVTHPEAQTVCLYDPVLLSVAAVGAEPISYQWLHDASPIDGETSSEYAIASATSIDAGLYSCIASNGCGDDVESEVALLTVLSPPQILYDSPADQEACQGDDAIFEVYASGSSPLSYRWYKDGQPIGQDSYVLTLESVVAADQGSEIYCEVSNECDIAISRNAVLTVMDSPALLEQPSNLTVCECEDATFEVVATGEPPLSYQWYNGGDPVGADQPTLTLWQVEAIDDGSLITCEVTNGCGIAISEVATLSVDPTCPPIGDCDRSCEIDLDDYAIFVSFIGGPGTLAPVGGECADLDDDGDADLADFAAFQSILVGSPGPGIELVRSMASHAGVGELGVIISGVQKAEPRAGGIGVLEVTFLGPMNEASCEDAANVSITNSAGDAVLVGTSAELDLTGTVLRITLDEALVARDCYTFDFAGMVSVGLLPMAESTFAVAFSEADVDGSLTVGDEDIALVLDHLGQAPSEIDNTARLDITKSGWIDVFDRNEVYANYGQTTPDDCWD